MNAYRLALGFLLLCGTGCAAPFNTFERALTDSGIARFEIAPPAVESEGRSVGIQAELGGPAGRGAIVGPTHVLTVDHVVGSHKEVWIATSRRRGRNRGWVRAHVRARYRAQPENIVLLELEVDDGFFGSLLGFTLGQRC